MIKLQANIQLFKDLPTSKDAIGKSFDIKVAGFKGSILFPSFNPEVDYVTNIHSMEWGMGENRNEKELIMPKLNFKTENTEWGYVSGLPMFDCQVKCLGISFEFKSKRNIKEKNEQINKALPDFFRRFQDYLEYRFKISLNSIKQISFCKKTLDFCYVDKNKLIFPHPINIPVTVTLGNNYFTFKDYNEAFKFASNKKDIRLEHLLLNNAILAHRHNYYRQALIELAASFELGLTYAIMEYFKKKKQNNLGKYETDGKTLGALIKIGNVIGIDMINKKTVEALLKERNNCVHRAIIPDRKIVSELINLVSEWNKKNIPLC